MRFSVVWPPPIPLSLLSLRCRVPQDVVWDSHEMNTHNKRRTPKKEDVRRHFINASKARFREMMELRDTGDSLLVETGVDHRHECLCGEDRTTFWIRPCPRDQEQTLFQRAWHLRDRDHELPVCSHSVENP